MSADPDLPELDDPAISREVFDAIVARHAPMVFGVGLRVLHDHHEAEDVVQLTFIELARQPGTVTREHLAGWLHRTAMNVARKILRTQLRRLRREAAKGSMMVATRQHDPGELREEIDAALDGLSAELREAVILHYLEDRDYDECALISGCSEGAIRKRAQRGLHRLRDQLADRGIMCGLDGLAAFLTAESAVRAIVPTGLIERLSQNLPNLAREPATTTTRKALTQEALRTKSVGIIAATAVVVGTLGLVVAGGPAKRWAAAALTGKASADSDRPTPGWSAADRRDFVALSLTEAASIACTEPIFRGTPNQRIDGLIPPYWGEFEARGIPFRVDEPGTSVERNLIALHGPNGDLTRQMPRSAVVACGLPAKAIHLLSGVCGWGFPVGFPRNRGKTVSMIVRLKYDDGMVEDHPLLNGVHFVDWFTLDDVPGSQRALVLKGGHQMRHLAIVPERTNSIAQIEFIKGYDRTAPVVMAVTVERAKSERR